MAGRIAQFVLETDSEGAPAARVAQCVLETDSTGFPAARISQCVLEVAYVTYPHSLGAHPGNPGAGIAY